MPRMVIGSIVATLMAGVCLAVELTALQAPSTCAPGLGTAPAERARRTAAVRLAQAINTAEARYVGQSRAYGPLDSLNVAVPAGFSTQLLFDKDAYVFSVKDSEDATCHFALFSDQNGVIYFAQPFQ